MMFYHRLFGRWLRFSTGYFFIYVLGNMFFFHKFIFELQSVGTLKVFFFFLLIFGSMICIGLCLVFKIGILPGIGIASCYFFLLMGVDFLLAGTTRFGFLSSGAIQYLLISIPRLLLLGGTPALIGICFFKDYSLKASSGLILIFISCLLMSELAFTTYFGISGNFLFSLVPRARALIEILSALTLVCSLAFVWGYALIHSLDCFETLGYIVMCIIANTVVIGVIQVTIGYRYLPYAIARSQVGLWVVNLISN